LPVELICQRSIEIEAPSLIDAAELAKMNFCETEQVGDELSCSLAIACKFGRRKMRVTKRYVHSDRPICSLAKCKAS
jgi:hypothetical protein